jgi:ABC-type multidrug transport system fused ATPase/permease subunit
MFQEGKIFNRGTMGFSRNNSEGRPPRNNRSLKLMAAGMTLIGFLVLIFSFAPTLAESLFIVPIMFITILLAVALFVSITTSSETKSVTTAEKRKRALDGLDMYSMIDRLVDDLDEDELDYLRRRLESREQGHDPKLAQSLEALLDQRSETRQSQKQ